MLGNLLIPEVSVLEKIIRPLAVYIFLLFAFRITGKRELGQMTPFDLIVLLTISNVLQNGMIGADNSLGGALIGAATLLIANGIVTRLAYHFPAFANLVEDRPTALIEEGRILHGNLRHEVMTMEELYRALRKHDIDLDEELHSIKRALLELDGTVSVIQNPGEDTSSGASDSRRRAGKLPQAGSS